MIAPVFISVFLRKVVIKRGRMGRFDRRGIDFWHLFVWRESSQPFLAVPKGAKRRSKKITLKNISSNRWSHIYFDIIQCKFDVLFQFFVLKSTINRPCICTVWWTGTVCARLFLAPGLPSNAVNKRSFGVLSWKFMQQVDSRERKVSINTNKLPRSRVLFVFLLSNHNDNVKRHDTTSLTLKAKVIAGGCWNILFLHVAASRCRDNSILGWKEVGNFGQLHHRGIPNLLALSPTSSPRHRPQDWHA